MLKEIKHNMNPGEKRFREVFGPFLENHGYHLRYGAYTKVDCQHLLIKQVFIRTIGRQWQVCARLATFYHYISFRKAEFCGTYFTSMDSIEEDPNIRHWLHSLPDECRDNYAKWKNVPREEADAFLKESVASHIDYQFQLFRKKVFALLDSPKSLIEGCANIKAMMELIAEEQRDWFDEIDLARVYFFIKQKEAAIDAIDHYFTRWNIIFKRWLNPPPEYRGGRYKRMLMEHGEELLHSRDAEREVYFKLKNQIETDDSEENFNIVKTSILNNALNMKNNKLLTADDYEKIVLWLEDGIFNVQER